MSSFKIKNKLLIKGIDILDLLHPIGSVIMFEDDTNPNNLYGGQTWVKVSEGRAIYGAGNLNDIDYVAGETKDAGLPNIYGFFTTYTYLNGYPQGAITTQISNTKQTGGSLEGHNYVNIIFNAKNYNNIYGNSTTVQPNAYIVNIWKRTA